MNTEIMLTEIMLKVCHAGVPRGIASCERDASALTISGSMKASKGRQGTEAANHVAVCLGVLRLPSVRSDVIVAMCTPTHISQNSAAAADTVVRDPSPSEWAPDLFNTVFDSFAVHDWSLFGES